MSKAIQKSKQTAETIKRSGNEYSVTLTDKGVTTEFTAVCPNPQQAGTGNDWKVSIEGIKSAKRWDDLLPYFESHELMGILNYDLQDWCRENLSVDYREYRAEMTEETIHNLFSN